MPRKLFSFVLGMLVVVTVLSVSAMTAQAKPEPYYYFTIISNGNAKAIVAANGLVICRWDRASYNRYDRSQADVVHSWTTGPGGNTTCWRSDTIWITYDSETGKYGWTLSGSGVERCQKDPESGLKGRM